MMRQRNNTIARLQHAVASLEYANDDLAHAMTGHDAEAVASAERFLQAAWREVRSIVRTSDADIERAIHETHHRGIK